MPAVGSGTRGAIATRRSRLSLEAATADALRKAFAELKLEWIRGDGPADGKFTFATWMADIPGPGHQARGFVWAPSRPAGQPRSPDRVAVEEYTPLEGNWYLFAELIDCGTLLGR